MSEQRHGSTQSLVRRGPHKATEPNLFLVEQHSIRLPPRDLTISQAGELERSADILRSAAKAVADLQEALETRDVHGVIVAQRRLVAIGGLARPSADRLERSLNV